MVSSLGKDYSWILLVGLLFLWKIGPIGRPEKSLMNYHDPLRNIPDEGG